MFNNVASFPFSFLNNQHKFWNSFSSLILQDGKLLELQHELILDHLLLLPYYLLLLLKCFFIDFQSFVARIASAAL